MESMMEGLNSARDMIAIFAVGGVLLIILTMALIVRICLRRERSKTEISSEEHTEYDAVDNSMQSRQADTAEYAAVGEANSLGQTDAQTYETLGGATAATDPNGQTYDVLGGVTATNQSDDNTYNALDFHAQSTPTEADTYSTVVKPERNSQSEKPAAQNNPAEPDVYAAVVKPAKKKQTSRPEGNQVTILSDEPQDAYSTVSINKTGNKETVHYNKNMVDNVLYGETK